MFPADYFAPRYFARSYFGGVGDTAFAPRRTRVYRGSRRRRRWLATRATAER